MESSEQNLEIQNVDSPTNQQQNAFTAAENNSNAIIPHALNEFNNDKLKELKKRKYFESFPPGYRFRPEDSELIVHYLDKKVKFEEPPPNKIQEVNLYLYNPKQLIANHPIQGEKEKEWYFFTPRDRKYKKGTRPNRAAGDGYWKATGADKPIIHDDTTVGFRKALVFHKGKSPKGDKTNWIMHEFCSVNQPPRTPSDANDMRLNDWVLCRVYEHVDKTKNQQNVEPVGNQIESSHYVHHASGEISQHVHANGESCQHIHGNGENFQQLHSDYNGIIRDSIGFIPTHYDHLQLPIFQNGHQGIQQFEAYQHHDFQTGTLQHIFTEFAAPLTPTNYNAPPTFQPMRILNYEMGEQVGIPETNFELVHGNEEISQHVYGSHEVEEINRDYNGIIGDSNIGLLSTWNDSFQLQFQNGNQEIQQFVAPTIQPMSLNNGMNDWPPLIYPTEETTARFESTKEEKPREIQEDVSNTTGHEEFDDIDSLLDFSNAKYIDSTFFPPNISPK